jgi:hypothetical protein
MFRRSPLAHRHSGLAILVNLTSVAHTKFLLLKVRFVTLPISGGLRFTVRPSLARQGGRGTRCESTRVMYVASIGA